MTTYSRTFEITANDLGMLKRMVYREKWTQSIFECLAHRLLQVNLDIHTFYGVGVDGSQMDEELIVDLDTMQFKSKGFLLPHTGICWVER